MDYNEYEEYEGYLHEPIRCKEEIKKRREFTYSEYGAKKPMWRSKRNKAKKYKRNANKLLEERI